MKEESVEFFRGNKQEIEYEKKRKSALMSCFPIALGAIDRTRYILVDDDKPNLGNHFGETYTADPFLALLSNEPTVDARRGQNQSEQPKKQQAKAAASIPNLENNIQTVNFDSRKESTTFLNPNKEEKQKTKETESSFGFESNNTKTNHNPFKPSPLYKELAGVYNNKPRLNRTISDSLGLESRNIESYADSLKTANINYNTNIISNTATIAKSDKQPGLYGWRPGKDYTEDLNKLKSQLPPIAASILNNSGIEIVVLKNLRTIDEQGKITPRNGRYYADENKVYLDSEHVNEYTLLSEAIHVVQDYLGMTGIGKSNLEFQEHVIKDLYYSQKLRKQFGDEGIDLFSASTNKEYIDLIATIFDTNAIIDLNRFLSSIEYCIGGFQENYNLSNSYQSPTLNNFNYNWRKIFDIFGIEYK